MAQTAIIHTASRVIRRITSDPSPFVAPDETAITPAAPIDLATNNGLLKLDGTNRPISCTLAEFRQAGLDDAQIATNRAQLRADAVAACDAILADATIVNPRLRNFATAIKALLS